MLCDHCEEYTCDPGESPQELRAALSMYQSRYVLLLWLTNATEAQVAQLLKVAGPIFNQA